FESLAASRRDLFTLTGTDRAERLTGRHVTASFFHALGIQPALGRDFTDADDRPDAAPVVIVSHEFWQRALGGAADIVGTMLRLCSASIPTPTAISTSASSRCCRAS